MAAVDSCTLFEQEDPRTLLAAASVALPHVELADRCQDHVTRVVAMPWASAAWHEVAIVSVTCQSVTQTIRCQMPGGRPSELPAPGLAPPGPPITRQPLGHARLALGRYSHHSSTPWRSVWLPGAHHYAHGRAAPPQTYC